MRKAVVTGGSRGIGRAIADALRADGAEVLTPPRADLDLADPAGIDRWAAAHAAAGVNVLVNCAGLNPVNPLERVADGDWARALQINLTGPMQLLRGLAGPMRAARWGRVVNVSSIWSVVGRDGRAAYAAAKAGLNALTRVAAVEFARDNVLVNAVCPGYVETDMTRTNNTPDQLEAVRRAIPLGRLAAPAEVARLVVFLCSEANTYLTGQAILIDGGYTSV